jgi:hypothetical protein
MHPTKNAVGEPEMREREIAEEAVAERMTAENANLIVEFVSKPEKKNLYIIVTGHARMRTLTAPLFVL